MAVDNQVLSLIAAQNKQIATLNKEKMDPMVLEKIASRMLSNQKVTIENADKTIDAFKDAINQLSKDIITHDNQIKMGISNSTSMILKSIESKPQEREEQKALPYKQENKPKVKKPEVGLSNKVINQIDKNLRYNITQSNNLKSGLGKSTGTILKAIKSNKPNDSSYDRSLNESTKTIIKAIKSNKSEDSSDETINNKLEEIRKINEDQKNSIDRYIQFRTSIINKKQSEGQFDKDEKGLTDKAINKEKTDKEKEDKKVKESFKSGLSGLAALAGGAAATVAAVLWEPMSRVVNLVKTLGPTIKSVSTNVLKTLGTWGKNIATKLTSPFKSVQNIAGKWATTAKGWFSKAGDGMKNLAGKAKGLLKSSPVKAVKNIASTVAKVPGIKQAISTSKFLAKKAPFISAIFEGADAAKMASMTEEEREKYLQEQKDKINDKAWYGRAWYGLNNNVKTLTAFGSELIQTSKALIGAGKGELQASKMEAELERKRAEREKQKEQEEANKPLGPLGSVTDKAIQGAPKAPKIIKSTIPPDLIPAGATEKEKVQLVMMYNEARDLGTFPLAREYYKNIEKQKMKIEERTGETNPVITGGLEAQLRKELKEEIKNLSTVLKNSEALNSSPSNNTVVNNQTSVTMPEEDYGSRFRSGARSR